MKTFGITTITLTLIILLIFGGFVAYVDPYLVFHQPTVAGGYTLSQETYISPGILKNYDYDLVITGTSLSSNFLTGDALAVFGGEKAVKATLRGAYSADFGKLFKFIKKSAKNVICDLRIDSFVHYSQSETMGLPSYPYTRNPFDDLEYLLGADGFSRALKTVQNADQPSVTLDEYASWGDPSWFSADRVLGGAPPAQSDMILPRGAYIEQVRENFKLDIEPTLKKHPGTDFWFYVPPYNMTYWRGLSRSGELAAVVAGTFELCDLLSAYQNAHVAFLAFDRDMIEDYGLYADTMHWNPMLNMEILQKIKSGDYPLTEEIKPRFEAFVSGYDYDSLQLTQT